MSAGEDADFMRAALGLARRGARCTGVDLSPRSLQIAHDLAARAGQEIRYVEANVLDAAAAMLRVVEGHLELRDAMFVLLLAPEAYLPLRQVGVQFHAASEGVAATEEIFDALQDGRATMVPDFTGDLYVYARQHEVPASQATGASPTPAPSASADTDAPRGLGPRDGRPDEADTGPGEPAQQQADLLNNTTRDNIYVVGPARKSSRH